MKYFFKKFPIKSIFANFLFIGLIFLSCNLNAKNDLYEKNNIIIATGSINGIYDNFGKKLCEIISSELGKKCVTQITTGSYTNLNYLEKKIAHFAIIQEDIFNDYMRINRNQNLYNVTNLYDEAITLITRQNSLINSPENFKNKIIGTNVTNINSYKLFLDLLNGYNIHISDIKEIVPVSLVNQTNMLCNNKVDILFLTIGHPGISTKELDNNCEIKFLPLNEKAISNIIYDNNYYHPYKIPAFLYNNVTDNIDTVAVKALFIANDNIDNKTRDKIALILKINIEQIKNSLELQ